MADRGSDDLASTGDINLFAGDGEMSRLMKQHDWSATQVGPIATWPQSLRIVMRILLGSRYAMWLGWGPQLTFFYNDAYARMTLGAKHPWALGRPTSEVWPEIWDDVGPRAESVLRTGKATWDEGLLLFLQRRGFVEESYHTFSYSPVPGDQGGIDGMLCVVTEETERVIGERRLRTLRELAARTTEEARSTEEACQSAARILDGNPNDIPFALLYLIIDARTARLAGATGLMPGSLPAPLTVDLTTPNDPEVAWPLAAVLASGRTQVVTDVQARLGSVRVGVYSEQPHTAAVLPVRKSGQDRLAGFLVAGISPRRPFDDDYRGFLDLLAGQVGTAIANARAHEEERQRAEALAELDRAKTAFFSNVSHEFRTPLTLMLGPVEDMLSRSYTELSPSVKGQLEVVNRNGLRLLRLVNSLLDFSRIEAGRVRAVYQATDLAAYTADLASVFRSACERAGLRLVVDCPPLSGPIFVDREMWEKIVLNLLSNAFKFTFVGEISVSLRQTSHAAVLLVHDTGTGISAEEMPHLFERFHRIENARGRTHEGSGIGLALVQELVKLHGGTIRAESVLGQGTTFFVSIPSGSDHLPPDQISQSRSFASMAIGAVPYVEEALRWLPDQADEKAPSELPAFHEPLPILYRPGEPDDDRPRVLVADDNADMRHYVARLLAEHFRVEAVPDGEAALASVRQRPPDLILSDVMMPRLDGFGLLRELRADPGTSKLPFIMLSARAGEESRVEGMQAGADDYLVKPFSARELLARVSAHLQMARMRQEASESLRQGEERLRMALTAARMVAWQYDLASGKVVVSDNAADVFGLPPGTLLETSDQGFALVHPEDVDQHRDTMMRAAQECGSYLNQFRLIRPDNGQVIWLEERGHAVCDPTNKATHLAGVVMDITDRKQAEQRERHLLAEAARANAQFRAFFEQGALFAGIMHVDGILIEANRLSLDACGYTREAVIGKVFWESPWWNRSPDLVEKIKAASAQAASGKIFRAELPYYVADGSERMVDLIILPIKDESGRVTFLAPTGTDITDRKRAEEVTRRRSEQLRHLAEVATRLNTVTDVPSVTGVVTEEARALIGSHQAATGFAVDQNWEQSINHVSLSEKYAQCRGSEVKPDGSGIYALVCESNRPMRLSQAELDAHPAYQKLGQHTMYPPPRGWLAAPLVGRDGRNFGLIQLSDKYEGDFTQEDEAILVQLAQMASVAIENARLVENLRDADRRKDEFLATLAHELRNPLAPLRNGLQVMKLSRGDGETLELARAMMERQLGQMVRLIDDLLDISRISRGKVTLQKQRVELARVIGHAVETSRPLIDASGHDLTTDLPTQPILVDADVTRLAQVFSNLLNNAAKYTERGGHITLVARRQGSQAVVSVRDTGVGIPAPMLPHVFEMFTQVDRSLERAQGGLGIGLSLVKGVVELHGGTVEARSDGHGLGSEFVVRLPIVQSLPSVEPSNEPVDGTSVSERRILIVDDNRDAAFSLSMLLRIMGNETQMAHDGLEGVETAAAFRPDVVFLDIGMPKLNGYEAARRIREQPWGKGVVLVALTGWGQEEDRRRSQEVGFNHHLVKPVDPATLAKLLAEVHMNSG